MIEKLEYQADVKIKKLRTAGKIQKVRSLHIKFPSKENIFVKINELVDAVNKLQAQVAILEEHAHPTATTDRMIGCTMLDIPKSYKNDQLTLATLDYSKKLQKENTELKDEIDRLETELKRTRKALDVAVDALKRIADAPIGYCMFAEEALDQITATLENQNGVINTRTKGK
jgi:septal ring factor EnvC (AmiA/AmiB activator)